MPELRRGIGGKSAPVVDSDCVNWGGRLNEHGYGRVTVGGGHQEYAHRLAYAEVHGPIPYGMTIDHLCFNPPCVNVSHLELITLAENLRRASARITHCPSGHPYDATNTRYYIQKKSGGVGRKCRACHRNWENIRRRRVAS